MANIQIKDLVTVIPTNVDLIPISQGGNTRSATVEEIRDKALRTEVETARGTEVNLDARLDKNDVVVANITADLSDKVNKTDNTKQLGGGYIINGDFRVNQRVVTGTVILTAGQYGHDRFKAGASGCTYTFASSGGITTITITAGSLIQVIEGINLTTGTYILSWGGTSQGKIGTGSYSVSGVSASVTGGTNLSIEFGIGTLSNIKLEKGTIVTPFIPRLYGEELLACKRYYQNYKNNNLWFHATAIQINAINASRTYEVEMRITPSITIYGLGKVEPGYVCSNDVANTWVAITSLISTSKGVNQLVNMANSFTLGGIYLYSYVADAEL